MEEQRIELSTGISMSYVEAGDPRGPAVLMLHGYTDTRRSFQGRSRSSTGYARTCA
jgi:pimeloyl-ACP methyl ester carboxylesterase